MAPAPRFMGNVYDQYPDDNTVKDVHFWAAGTSYIGFGDRHVLIQWNNGTGPNGETVAQIIQLTGQAGNYAYYSPVANILTDAAMSANTLILLGQYSREQRNEILRIAESVAFERTSTTNGCRVWTRDLFIAMIDKGLLDPDIFNTIDASIPLVQRRAEV